MVELPKVLNSLSMNFMVIVKKIKFLWNHLSNVVEYIRGEKAVI